MFAKLKSFFSKPSLTEENVIKQINRWKMWYFERPHFAKKYIGVETFWHREDLRNDFLDRFTEEMKTIVTSRKPVYFFWRKIINNTKIHSVQLMACFWARNFPKHGIQSVSQLTGA